MRSARRARATRRRPGAGDVARHAPHGGGGELPSSARTDALVIGNSISMARAEAAADAGVTRAVWESYRIDNSPERGGATAHPHEWSFDGVAVRVEMRDESAKIDVNTASDALLRGLLVSIGLTDEEATRLVDAILDWRDPDSLKRVNGAEESDYQAAGLTYRPANAPFQAIEEIQLVLGMRPDIYRRLAPIDHGVLAPDRASTRGRARARCCWPSPASRPSRSTPSSQRRDEARASRPAAARVPRGAAPMPRRPAAR